MYKVLEAIEDGNGGEASLIAKGFVANGLIEDLKATANSFLALGLEARHGTTTKGIEAAKKTPQEAREIIRDLIRGSGITGETYLPELETNPTVPLVTFTVTDTLLLSGLLRWRLYVALT
jgi:hypothetical protein